MATVIATAVIGLEPTKGLINRLDSMLHSGPLPKNKILAALQSLRGNYLRFAFLLADMMPAIRRKRKNPTNDVISYMVSKNKSRSRSGPKVLSMARQAWQPRRNLFWW